MKLHIKTLSMVILLPLFASCSVVPKDSAKLTGMQTLAEWKSSLDSSSKDVKNRTKYETAKRKLNSLIDPKLHTTIDTVANESVAGLGFTVDLSNATTIDSGTKSAVESYLSIAGGFGGSGTEEITTQVAAALLKWAAGAAAESREKSAENLKKKINEYKWPEWNDLQ